MPLWQSAGSDQEDTEELGLLTPEAAADVSRRISPKIGACEVETPQNDFEASERRRRLNRHGRPSSMACAWLADNSLRFLTLS